MGEKVDFLVKIYHTTLALQKQLNQWKHEYDIEILAFDTTCLPTPIGYTITVVIKRTKKTNSKEV